MTEAMSSFPLCVREGGWFANSTQKSLRAEFKDGEGVVGACATLNRLYGGHAHCLVAMPPLRETSRLGSGVLDPHVANSVPRHQRKKKNL